MYLGTVFSFRIVGCFHRCFDGGVLFWGLLSVSFPGVCSVFGGWWCCFFWFADVLGVGALGVGALGSSSGLLGCPLYSFFRMTCIHLFSELGGSSGSGAGFDTSIAASFSGFSFVVSVVWMFFWGRLSRGGRPASSSSMKWKTGESYEVINFFLEINIRGQLLDDKNLTTGPSVGKGGATSVQLPDKIKVAVT